MRLKILILFFYSALSSALFIYFDVRFDVWVSFAINFLVLTFILLYHLFVDREYSPFISSYIVFHYLFFIVAPIVQIISLDDIEPKFITNFPYNYHLAIFANSLILIFHIFFFTSYYYLSRINVFSKPNIPSRGDAIVRPLTIITVLLFTVLIAISSFDFIQNEINRPSWKATSYSTPILLIWKKVFFMVPFGGLILSWQYFKQSRKTNAINFIVILSACFLFLIFLIWFKNPLTEKRNALGPIFISLIFLFIPKLINTNTKTIAFLFFTMVIGFPLSAIFTHTDAGWKEILRNPMIFFEHNKAHGVAETFNTLHYDAYFNAMTTIDYVAKNDITYGENMFGTIMFAIPRSIWDEKPIPTGEFIGSYLMNNYGFSYSNLANPLVSEGYFNFGIFGVILFAFLLALTIKKLSSWLYCEDYIKKIMAFYFAIHLIFLLRGDLTNAFSYYVGILVGVWILIKIVNYLIKAILLIVKP